MNREFAFEELRVRLLNPNMIKHSLSVEAIMRAFAKKYGDDEEKWGLSGLLHDIDYERTKDDPANHGLVAEQILDTMGIDNFIIYAIKAHNNLTGLDRKRRLDKILYSADPLSGLITECAMILPSKKLEDVDLDFVLKKFKQSNFAKGADRAQIKRCEEAEIKLEEFIKVSLQAMKDISSELGL